MDKDNTIEHTNIKQWGNSKATRIPASIVKKLDLKDDQELTINIKDGSIILTPIKKTPSTIYELFEDWEDDGERLAELDWGESKGNEVEW